MADLAVTAANVRIVFAEKAVERSKFVASAVTAGTPLYQKTDGNLDPTNAGAIATAGTPYGIALEDGAAGDAISVLKSGYLAGFDLSALNAGAPIYLSITAGKLADAAPAGTGKVVVPIGRVETLTDPNKTKVLRVQFVDSVVYTALP